MTGAQGLLNAALVGSSRAVVSESLPATTPEGGLVGLLGEASREQRLLLAAGIRAVYRLAGYTPERVEVPLEPAPTETKAICPPNIAQLMHELFPKGDVELQREALERMIAAGMILPPEMAPMMLDVERTLYRTQVAKVVGERGAWLARFNSDWQWVLDERVIPPEELAANAETIWRDGSPAERLQALAYWRTTDRARARDEVMAVWRQEKGDFRYRMLIALIPTWDDVLPDDEQLLETALDDRNTNVRSVAQRALAHIPGSAYSQRAIARADTLVSMGRKKLEVKLPEAYEKSWERDGIERKPQSGTDEPVWWLTRILAMTPPVHWVERFGQPPAEIIAALPGDRFMEVLEGWALAAARHDARDWAAPLLQAWLIRPRSGKRSAGELSEDVIVGLLMLLPRNDLEAMMLNIVRESETKQDVPWSVLVVALPQPWSAELARAWLASLRVFAAEGLADAGANSFRDQLACDGESAVLLPLDCLDEALDVWAVDESNKAWQAITWRENLDKFLKAVRLRQRIRDEIPG